MKNVLFVSNEELGRVYERTKLSIKIEGLVTETDALFRHVRNMTQERRGKLACGLRLGIADWDGNRVGKPDSSCLLESNLLEWIERVI